jgi:hypothetical protein
MELCRTAWALSVARQLQLLAQRPECAPFSLRPPSEGVCPPRLSITFVPQPAPLQPRMNPSRYDSARPPFRTLCHCKRCALRLTCCGRASMRTARTERDDRAMSGTTRYRTGRRGGERDDGVGIAIEAARRQGGGRAARAEFPFDRWKRRETTEKLPKSYFLLPYEILVPTRPVARSYRKLPNSVQCGRPESETGSSRSGQSPIKVNLVPVNTSIRLKHQVKS